MSDPFTIIFFQQYTEYKHIFTKIYQSSYLTCFRINCELILEVLNTY